MGLFTFNIHADNTEVLHEIKQLKKLLMSALDDIKAKLATSDEKIDILNTATEGVTADIAAIKAKLEANQGGIDAAGVAELTALVDAQSTKLSEAATKLSDLDAETDPNA